MLKATHGPLRSSLFFVVLALAGEDGARAQGSAAWKAGVAAVDISPQESIWLAGYGARNRPSEGVAQKLYARALALEDPPGHRLVIVTTDILGFPRAVAEPIVERVRQHTRLARDQLLLTSTHTHAGPVLREYSVFAYGLTLEQRAAIERYTQFLQEQVVQVVLAALADVSPARLTFGETQATFGTNRRVSTERGYVIGVNPQGLVDPQVPVLKVQGSDGKLRAVLFSYACHNTTLGPNFYQAHGDYSGVAQAQLEESFPGAKALFLSGCGGDINPNPRGSLELAEQHGKQLAAAVQQALEGTTNPVEGNLATAFELVPVPWALPPSREELQKRLQENDLLRRRHARRMLDIIEQHGSLPKDYPYPVQVARLGTSLTLIGLGGEVVVDYALRLKRELTSGSYWIAAYANDVMGYIPSRRVLEEGGYEGGGSMIFYGQPGPWAPEVEETIVAAVHQLVKRTSRDR